MTLKTIYKKFHEFQLLLQMVMSYNIRVKVFIAYNFDVIKVLSISKSDY